MDEEKLAELIQSVVRSELKELQHDMLGRFDRLEHAQDKTNARLDNIEGVQHDMLSRFDRLEHAQDKTNARLDNIEGVQHDMLGGFDRLEHAQGEMLQMLKDHHTEARSEAKQLLNIQSRQQRVIELLSSRLVQNEKDVRSLQDDVSIIKDQLPKT